MRARVYLRAAVFMVLVLSALALAFFRGWWIPNEPSRSAYPVRGIDVSAHQGNIDWNQVAASDVRFVYLKATEGGDFRDANFTANLQGVRAAGLAVGAYHFFSLKTPGSTQAQNFIATVAPGQTNLPPAIDLEFWGNTAERPAPDTFQAELRTYITAIQAAYHRDPILYTSPDFADVYLKGFPTYNLWVRAILTSAPAEPPPWIIWQYSDRGRVPGIAGFVDKDVFNGTAAQFEQVTSHP